MKEHDLLFLRFKYYSFMDIDPRVSGRSGEVRVGGRSEEVRVGGRSGEVRVQ